jgi:tetratricopeptide (TPR) repeat protein
MTAVNLTSIVPEYRSRGRRKELRELLQKLVDEQPENRSARMELATEHRVAGDFAAALELLMPLAADVKFAGQLQCLLEIGRTQLAAGETEQAMATYRHAHSLFPNNHWPVLDIAELEYRRGNLDSTLTVIADGFARVDPRGRAQLAQFAASVRGARDFLSSRWKPSWGAKPIASANWFDSAAMLLLIKDESDIIRANLEHHYNIGFRVFFVIDNRSEDNTADLVRMFRNSRPDALVFYAYDQIQGHYQAAKMRAFRDLLVSYTEIARRKIDWIFFVDADEFLTYVGPAGGEGRIAPVLANPETSLLALMWVNCAGEEPVVRTDRSLSPFDAFPLVQGVLKDIVTKVGVRRTAAMDPAEGNHFVQSFPFDLGQMELLSSVDWYMFHFPFRSIEQVRRKVVNGGLAFQGTSGLENYGDHWKKNYDSFIKNGEGEIDRILRGRIQMIRNSMVVK